MAKANGDIEFVTRAEFDELRDEVMQMSENVNTLTQNVSVMSQNVDKHVCDTRNYLGKLDSYQEKLIAALTNSTPEGHIPMASHHRIIKGLLWSFTVVVVVAIGAVKLAPVLIGKF